MTERDHSTAPWRQDYDFEVLAGLPPTGPPALDFRVTNAGHGREGLVVAVRTPARQWVGNFQHGDGTVNQVIPAPARGHLCVVAGGRGYWVNVHEPQLFEVIPIYPVREVRPSPDTGLLILADDTDLAAYDLHGRKWLSGRVSWDGVEILTVDASGVTGRGWDAVREAPVGFFVDAETGKVDGGAAPPSAPSSEGSVPDSPPSE